MEVASPPADPASGHAFVATLVGGFISPNREANKASREALLALSERVVPYLELIASSGDAASPKQKRLLRLRQQLRRGAESQTGFQRALKQALIACLLTSDAQLTSLAITALRWLPDGADLVATEAFCSSPNAKRCTRLLQATERMGALSVEARSRVRLLMLSKSRLVREAADRVLMRLDCCLQR